MNINEARLLLEEFENKEKIEVKLCNCDGNQIVSVNGFDTCTNCGTQSLESCEVTHEANDNSTAFLSRRSLYKRRLYCIEKLRLMSSRKACNDPNYKTVIAMIRSVEGYIGNIKDLKFILNQMRLNKYYRFIYSMYFDLKKEKLIELSDDQIQLITNEFVKVDVLFKRFFETYHYRRNIMSYSAVIFLIMKDLKIPGRRHIILPYNFKEIKKLYKKLTEHV